MRLRHCLLNVLIIAIPTVASAQNGTLTTLYSFSPVALNANPTTALIQGSDGNFYGTTPVGGSNQGQGEQCDFVGAGYGCSSIFQITAAGSLQTLYTFPADEGATASLVQGNDGNFYGTSNRGGSGENGYVFSITP